MPNLSERFLTVAETARELGVSRDTVYRRVERGEWPAIRLGDGPKAPIRIDPNELAARLVPAGDLLALDVVAARIGKPLEWCLARVRLLPCRQVGGETFVDAGDLRAWLEAAQEAPQTRSGGDAA